MRHKYGGVSTPFQPLPTVVEGTSERPRGRNLGSWNNRDLWPGSPTEYGLRRGATLARAADAGRLRLPAAPGQLPPRLSVGGPGLSFLKSQGVLVPATSAAQEGRVLGAEGVCVWGAPSRDPGDKRIVQAGAQGGGGGPELLPSRSPPYRLEIARCCSPVPGYPWCALPDSRRRAPSATDRTSPWRRVGESGKGAEDSSGG